MTAAHLFCSIYHSSRREGMYLYVNKARGLEAVPDALRERFGVADVPSLAP